MVVISSLLALVFGLSLGLLFEYSGLNRRDVSRPCLFWSLEFFTDTGNIPRQSTRIAYPRPFLRVNSMTLNSQMIGAALSERKRSPRP